MVYSTKKMKETKKKQSQNQKQSGKTALNLNGNEKHLFSDVYIRRLKTCYSLRMNTYLEIKQVPTLRLMGNWLRKAGFEIGDYTTILVSEGVLVIRKEENPE